MAGSLAPSSYPVPVDRLFMLHLDQETVDVLRALTKILESAQAITAEIRKTGDGSIEVMRVHREQKFLRQQSGAGRR